MHSLTIPCIAHGEALNNMNEFIIQLLYTSVLSTPTHSLFLCKLSCYMFPAWKEPSCSRFNSALMAAFRPQMLDNIKENSSVNYAICSVGEGSVIWMIKMGQAVSV